MTCLNLFNGFFVALWPSRCQKTRHWVALRPSMCSQSLTADADEERASHVLKKGGKGIWQIEIVASFPWLQATVSMLICVCMHLSIAICQGRRAWSASKATVLNLNPQRLAASTARLAKPYAYHEYTHGCSFNEELHASVSLHETILMFWSQSKSEIAILHKQWRVTLQRYQ